MTEESKDFIIEKGSSVDYGARPLRRAVEQYLEDSMSEALLRGEFVGKETVTVKVGEVDGEKKLVFEASGGVAEPIVAADAAH